MDKKTILKIANLAKIEIDDSKANEIKTNLEKILNLVDEMNQVDTDNIEPMSHPLNLKQYLRDDEVTENNKRDLFQENNNFVFMDLETYEQFEVSSDIIGDQIHFLSDGMEVLVNSYESQVISIDLPETCEVEVIEADAVIKGQTVSSSYKPATIKNGIKIMVPGHIEVGTKIIIKPADGTYVEKSKL